MHGERGFSGFGYHWDGLLHAWHDTQHGYSSIFEYEDGCVVVRNQHNKKPELIRNAGENR